MTLVHNATAWVLTIPDGAVPLILVGICTFVVCLVWFRPFGRRRL